MPFSAMDEAPACETGHLISPKNPVQFKDSGSICKQNTQLSHKKN